MSEYIVYFLNPFFLPFFNLDWHFNELRPNKFGNPYIWYVKFFRFEILIPLCGLRVSSPAILPYSS